MNDSGLTTYRRRLPHWRLSGALYFVTWRVAKPQPELISSERDLVVAALNHHNHERYELTAYVVMNDHVHVLVRPLGRYEPQRLVHSWKSFTAREMQHTGRRVGAVWQDEYFDRIVRDDKEFEQKMNYIRQNPWKRWPELKTYQWVWSREN